MLSLILEDVSEYNGTKWITAASEMRNIIFWNVQVGKITWVVGVRSAYSNELKSVIGI